MNDEILKEIEKLEELEKYEEIINIIENLQAEQLNTEIIEELARAYVNIQKYEKAIEILKSIENEGKNSVDWNYRMGYSYYYLKDYKNSEKYFLKAVELGDTDTGLYSLAIVYNDDDIKLLNLKPDEKKAKIKLRDKYLKQLTDEGFTHESLKELRNHKLAAAISGNAYSIYRLAVYYYGTKNYKLAEKYAKEFLKFDKKNPEILNILSGASK